MKSSLKRVGITIWLHISMNYVSDALSSVLVDTRSSPNVMPKSTLSRLSFQGAPMRGSGIIVKAFDGSHKIVIGEVDLLMTIGPHFSQITFQVMDIEATYNCLLGRPWIHEVGTITSTLHQKLKFVNEKLMTVCGEQALIVSYLSLFSYVKPEDVIGAPFQALSISDQDIKRSGPSICSIKDAQKVVNSGATDGWEEVVIFPENKSREGLGFSFSSVKVVKKDAVIRHIQEVFCSRGFIRPTPPEVSAIIEDDPERDSPDLVVHEVICQNWTVVDVPPIIHISK